MTNKETIYRQDVLDLAKKGVLISNGSYKSVCKAINELPSVNPQEPKTDSWSIKDVVDTFKKHGLIREQEPCEDAIDRKLVCAFIAGLISDDVEREKGLEYIRNMPPVNPQPCEDAISRQAVLDILKREGRKWGNDYRDWVDAIEEIKNLSSVNPTKTGHWVGEDGKPSHLKDGMTTKSVWCSLCGKWLTASDEYSCFGKFCPNCGAKMVEPQESEE